MTCEVTSAVTNRATRATRRLSPGSLLIVEPPLALIDVVEDVEGLPNGRADGLAPVDELPVFADVSVEVRQEFRRDFDAYLGH